MEQLTIELDNEHGIHTRAAAQIVDCALQFASRITLRFGASEVDAKRIMQVLTLGAKRGDKVVVSAEGADEMDAMASLCRLIEQSLI